jgi:SynChlorMet cassette protein ScmC
MTVRFMSILSGDPPRLDFLFHGFSGWTGSPASSSSVIIWSHLEVPNIICELSPKKNNGRELVMMWYALHIIYSGLTRSGGLPLHAALVSIGGMGSLIAGGDGAGKSTCCRRITNTWNVLADDGVLIVPRNAASFAAHPLPTWSDLIMDRNQRTCVIEEGVPLSAIFFLEKDSEDCAIPLGQGHASLMINASASGVFRQGLKKPDPVQDRNLKRLVFDNSCRIGKTVPAFLLRVSPSGEFWKRMEGVLSSSEKSPGNSSVQHRH